MNTRPPATKPKKWRAALPGLCLSLWIGGTISPDLLAQTTNVTGSGAVVETIGGGPRQGSKGSSGKRNGNTFLDSQFNDPFAAALDRQGNLYIADRANGLIRKITTPGASNSVTTTLISGLDKPVDVATDQDNNIYVLTQGDGAIRRYRPSGRLRAEVASGLSNPTALAVDSDKNIYVAELGGNVIRILAATGDFDPDFLISDLNQPRGLALLDDNTLAISDSGNNQVHVIDFLDEANSFTIGAGSAGFAEGSIDTAQFNKPQKIAAAPNGTLVVADRLNHRVRLISPAGTVSTLYGMDKANWNQAFFPGWADGAGTGAAARDPIGVTVANDGTVYTTEIFYDLIRRVTGAALSSTNAPTPGGNGGGTNVVVVTPPTISPTSGFFPAGGQVRVISPRDCQTFYTLDGTEPTTNSFLVPPSGLIFFNNPVSDLRALRVKTFCGGSASVTVSGQASTVNEIGVPTDIQAGIGATVLVPVVVNLRPNQSLRTIQFRVEVRPEGGAPAVSDQFRALSLTTNDFVAVATPGSQPGVTVTFNSSAYHFGTTRGLVITAIEVDTKFLVTEFAVVALLAVPIPPSAFEGQQYTIEVIAPSGTSDGRQNAVALTPMTPRTIEVANVPYLVGDTAPGRWYNAGDFGDAVLNNDDVNNAFFASLGIRIPPSFTDVFDAMDAYPDDGPGVVGGDGQIRFLDWQRILQRSLGLDPVNWIRSWSVGGVRISRLAGGLGNISAGPPPPPAPTPAPGAVWVREGLLSAGSVEQAIRGHEVNVPVYVRMAAGSRLAGLNFRATATAQFNSPQIGSLKFVPALGLPQPLQGVGSEPNTILCGWPLVPSAAFQPNLEGTTLLGYLRFLVPVTATKGDCYRVTFSYADGSPDIQTQYNFETLPGCVWVESLETESAPVVSPEWKTYFFGANSGAAADDADPDGDSVSNVLEYLEGTSPTDGRSVLTLVADDVEGGVLLQWLTAPGKVYALDGAVDIANPAWRVIAPALTGDGQIREFIDTDSSHQTRFYRVRVVP